MPEEFDPAKHQSQVIKSMMDKKIEPRMMDEVEKFKQAELDAHNELRERLKQFRIAQTKEKEEWLFQTLQFVAPLWAVKWALVKNRGWVLRFFGVSVDVVGFNRNTELFEIRKGGKMVAVKLFFWHTGDHLEGVRK